VTSVSRHTLRYGAAMLTSVVPSLAARFLCLAFIGAALAGCGASQEKAAGEKVVARHFALLASGSYDDVLAGYAPEFFGTTSREEWRSLLARVGEKLGPYRSHGVTTWRVFSGFGSMAGTRVVLSCRVVYEKHAVDETFTLFRAGGDAPYRILGHQIQGGTFMMD